MKMKGSGLGLAEMLGELLPGKDERSQEERDYDCDAGNYLTFVDINSAAREITGMADTLVEEKLDAFQILVTVAGMQTLLETLQKRLTIFQESVIEVHAGVRRAEMKVVAEKKFPPRKKPEAPRETTRMTEEEIDRLSRDMRGDCEPTPGSKFN